MYPDAVCDCSLRDWQDGSANDGHDHDSGTVAGERTEFRNTEGEDAGEHDGVEETYGENAPHCHVTGRKHGDRHEGSSTGCADAKQVASFHLAQKRRAKESPDHCAGPIERDVAGGRLLGQTTDLRLAEIVNQETSD